MANTEGASPSQARRLWGLESVVSSPSRVLDKASVDIGSVQRFLQTPKHQEKGSLSWESASSEGPKIKAKSGSVVWEGQRAPFHQLDGLESVVSSATGVRQRARPPKSFTLLLALKADSSGTTKLST